MSSLMFNIWFPLNKLSSPLTNHLKFIQKIRDKAGQVLFRLYHFFCSGVIPLDLTIDTNCGYCSIIEVPHKQIYGNFYTRSRTIKARPSLVLDFTTTVSVQKLCLLIPPNPPHPKKKFLLNKSCFPCANLLKFIKKKKI